MCGEHAKKYSPTTGARGSSPRVRGTPAGPVPDVRAGGIIPACAGNTSSPDASRASSEDHPRVCGEHSEETNTTTTWTGSSPRVRGTPTGALNVTFTTGIIPACAGNTGPVRRRPEAFRDHPRVCGEHTLTGSPIEICVGSSPRVRGTHQAAGSRVQRAGIIPACAGNTYT